MKRIYFDQAATSFPKAPGIAEAIKYYLEEVGVNINRGVYQSALSAEETIVETREAICRLFKFDKPQNVVFTLNITHALNYLLKGILKENDHCLVSSMEHNAVMRPLEQLAAKGVSYTRIQADSEGCLNSLDVKTSLRSNTRAVVMIHASNVSGTILPLAEIGKMCKEYGLIFIIDTAQTAGSLDIDFCGLNADALAFTGHKGLLGPQGIGGFVLTKELAESMKPLISGGTGSLSDREEIPPFLPDKFEAGTLNIPGIFGLHRALGYLESEGLENLHHRAMSVTGLFLEGIHNIPGIKIIGHRGIEDRVSVVSLDFTGRDNGAVAYSLEKLYGIMTRSGLHCAPSAHQTLGTFPQGTVRFSFNHFNTVREVYYALDAINKILKSQ
jgi:cysteine desulfurase family protein